MTANCWVKITAMLRGKLFTSQESTLPTKKKNGEAFGGFAIKWQPKLWFVFWLELKVPCILNMSQKFYHCQSRHFLPGRKMRCCAYHKWTALCRYVSKASSSSTPSNSTTNGQRWSENWEPPRPNRLHQIESGLDVSFNGFHTHGRTHTHTQTHTNMVCSYLCLAALLRFRLHRPRVVAAYIRLWSGSCGCSDCCGARRNRQNCHLPFVRSVNFPSQIHLL